MEGGGCGALMRVGIRTCAYVVRLLFLRMGCSLCDFLCNSVEPYVRPARLDELSIETEGY